MATTEPEIKVFAMFPTDSGRSNWTWVHCLTFELAALNELHFSSKPYKWIRYATGIVVGAQGDISSERNSPDNVMNYDDDLISTSANLYYHISPAERQKMFYPDKPNSFGDRRLPSGSPVRMPATTVLFDTVYAGCVLHRFSSKTLKSTLKQWKSTFYPREITNAGQASYQKIIDH